MSDRGKKGPSDQKSVSRRGFLSTVSTTAAAAADVGAAIPAAAVPVRKDGSEPTLLVLNVNGRIGMPR